MELQGKVAIITGGAAGIGAACVECCLREGAQVMIVDRKAPAGGNAAFISADISNATDADRAVAATVEKFGGVDILVNNAAIQTYGDAVTTTEEIWDRTMNINLKG